MATKKNEDKAKRGRGRPRKKKDPNLDLLDLTAEEIVPIRKIKESLDISSIINQIPDNQIPDDENDTELTDSELEAIRSGISPTIQSMSEKIRLQRKLLKDERKNHKQSEIETKSVSDQIEKLREWNRRDQESLAKTRIEYENSNSDYVLNRSPIIRWVFKAVFGYKDRLVIKSEIAILSEKISQRTFLLSSLERKQVTCLLKQKSIGKLIRTIENSYDSLLEKREQFQKISSRIKDDLASREIEQSRKSLSEDYQSSLEQLKLQSVTEEKFLTNIYEDRSKVEEFLKVIQSSDKMHKPVLQILEDLDISLEDYQSIKH